MNIVLCCVLLSKVLLGLDLFTYLLALPGLLVYLHSRFNKAIDIRFFFFRFQILDFHGQANVQ